MVSTPPTGMYWIGDLDTMAGITFAARATISGTPIATTTFAQTDSSQVLTFRPAAE